MTLHHRTLASSIAAITVGALLIGIAPAAMADSKPPALTAATAASDTETFALSGATLEKAGYTYEDAVRELVGNPYISAEREPVDEFIQTRGVSFGWYIYVRVNKSQAKALVYASATAAAGIVGLATGGVGGVIAASLATYAASVGADNLDRCKRWEFKFNYAGRGRGLKCLQW
jgi:hypothetical protein